MVLQIKEIDFNRAFMLKVIAEREGVEKAQAMNEELSIQAIDFHFDYYYKAFAADTPSSHIIEEALEQMKEREFTNMLKRNEFSDIFEMLTIEGYLTNVDNQWVLSTECPYQNPDFIA